jgi:hypothetical protein
MLGMTLQLAIERGAQIASAVACQKKTMDAAAYAYAESAIMMRL